MTALDRNLDDLSNALRTLQQGLTQHANLVREGMPDEAAAHEELDRLAAQIGQTAEGAAMLRADQRRRLASDHERIENGRRNEPGYDHTANQD